MKGLGERENNSPIKKEKITGKFINNYKLS